MQQKKEMLKNVYNQLVKKINAIHTIELVKIPSITVLATTATLIAVDNKKEIDYNANVLDIKK